MNTEISIGLVGCGKIAQRHIEWFSEHPGCAVTALCDLSTDAMTERAEAIRALRPGSDVRQYADHRELLADPDLDAVAVLLPHHLHFAVCRDALQVGKHVLVEKPMVTEVNHALELGQLAESEGRILGIGYQRSTMSEYRYVKRMIESGELGRVRFISAHLEQTWYGRFWSANSGDSWRKHAEMAGGGQLVDSGSHTLSSLLDVTGLVPAEAFAFVDRADIDLDINTAAAVRFTTGALASLSIGGFGHSVTDVLRVVGEKHSARIFFRTVNEQSLEIDGATVDARAVAPGTTPNANFINAILGTEKLEAGPQLGLRVAQLTNALLQSAEVNRPVVIEG